MARFGFDPNEYKDQVNNFSPVPRGIYKLKAIEAEEFDTRAGDGTYIRVVFEVVDGDYARRKIFQNFNINNPSEQAQDIGRGQVYAWRMACNRPTAEDSDQLLEIPFMGAVDVEEGKGGYGPQNRIRRFLDPNEVVKQTEARGPHPRTEKPAQPDLPGTEHKAPERREPARAGTGSKKPWDDEIPF